MTRIIAGTAGGRRLRTPAGTATRPTAERVREALFSALESQLGTLAGCSFLDVYAGSGAVGLEAASRGASAVVLVEHNVATADLIRANARSLGFDEVTVVATTAERLAAGRRPPRPVDVAFFDPPYALPLGDVHDVLTGLSVAGWFAVDALVVIERPRRETPWSWPDGFAPDRMRKYGETMLWFGRRIYDGEPDDTQED